MSDPIVTGAGSIAPGQIQFYDSIQPPLPAGGEYQLQVVQNIVGLKDGTQPQYSATQKFEVDGPRFQIDPTSIHMVFPPANQGGMYHGVLPNIVFGTFAMPWLRKIDPSAPPSNTAPPWMGLLTIYQNEMPGGTTPQLSAPAVVTVGQLVAPSDTAILPPVLPDVAPANTGQVQVVDVQLAYFLGIAPALTELPVLAHAREVNTDGKVIAGVDEDGCFSVLMSNRVVQDGASNTVYLVSLEGHQNHLPQGPAIAPQYKKIRLVVLGSWSFTASRSPGSFLELMRQLCSKGHGGVDLLMMTESDITAKNALAHGALQSGYTALANDMRIGERSTSWYRGPLVPAPTQRDFSYGPYHTSDHAMNYDPDCGVFSHAYSAAWQIGRLLALSDPHFSRSLYNWRRRFFAAVKRTIDFQAVEDLVAPAMRSGANLTGAGVPAHMREFLRTQLLPLKDDLPRVIPRERNPMLAELSGVLTPAEVEDVVATGEDPVLAIKKKLQGGGE